ncbi:MAG: beta-ketoacyl-[acyl-carrier-protein] synthase family protein [Deltaproteobacteria bacterium]|nr:beta-ketoacyl-[acyl-carrier-protein] synthase family protein [Deltaproteobacteria bacterium]
MTDVVITGYGAITPIGLGVEDFAAGLRGGACGVGTIDLFDASAYRSSLGGQIRGDIRTEAVRARCQAAGVPLQTRYGRTAVFSQAALGEALQMAGLHADDLGDGETGLAFGGCTAGTFESEGTLLGLEEGQDYWDIVPPMELLITPVGTTADVLLTVTGVRGPVTTISTACSSATNAIGLGMRWIQAGRASRVIVGGADGLCRLTHCGFNALRLVSDDTPRPFDARRNGMVIGEGAAVLVLEDAERARARGATVQGRLLGFGNGAEAHHATQPRPDGSGAAAAMQGALDDAGLDPGRIDYINAHGTATPQNDVTEARGAHLVFGDRATGLPMSSTKSQTGHTLGASGAIEVAAVLLGMKHGFLPPTVSWAEQDPEIDIDPVPNEARAASLGVALSNSFAFGGNDASLCVAHPDVEVGR